MYELMISRSEISETFLRSVAASISADIEQTESFTGHERSFFAGKENTSEWAMVGATGTFSVLFERHESYLSVHLSCPGKETCLIARQVVWEAYRASGGNVAIHPRPEDKTVSVASSKKNARKKGVK